MLNTKPVQNRLFYKSIAVVFLLVIIIWLFQVEDTYRFCLLLLIISLVLIRPLSFRCWSLIDVLLCVITFYDISSCFYGACTIPALRIAFLSVFCTTSYLILRKLFSESDATRIILLGSYFPIGVALLLTICSFFIFRDSVLSAGFEDVYNCRFLFRPLGYMINQWASLLLILFGWICLIRQYSSIFLFLAAFTIFLSFSRGTYIAFGVYLIAWLILQRSLREKIRIVIISLMAAVVTIFCLPNEIKTTLQMNITVSQQQSAEARINSTSIAWNVFKNSKHYHLFGYGSGSYPFVVDRAMNQDSTQTYTAIAPNLPIQLLIEKGFLGLMLYLFLIFAISRYIWKYRREAVTCTICCTLLALIVKEMTQANLFSTPLLWLMVYVMLAFFQRRDVCVKNVGLERYIIPIIVSIFYLSWFIFTYFHVRNESLCYQSFMALKEKKIHEAVTLIEQTSRQTPYLIQRGWLYTQCYRRTNIYTYAEKAKLAFKQAQMLSPEDVQIDYLQAQLYLYIGEIDRSRFILERLVELYPKNSIYLLKLWENLYSEKQKDKALPYLVNAIYYTPRILRMECIQDLPKKDSVYFLALHQQLSHLKLRKHSPAELARLGYIAHWCGYQAKAEVYLKEAVTALPNLSTPWRLLGEEKKYRLLVLGAFKKDIFSIPIPNEATMSNEQLLIIAYRMKFRDWYGSELGSCE